MKKILLSLMTVGIVSAVAIAGTTAYFSDTEVSEDNVFQSGALDLKVDSTSHYNGMICTLNPSWEVGSQLPQYIWAADGSVETLPMPELIGAACTGTWSETDLGGEKFFSFTDVKPGDWGEDTVSLHVYDNDAWGRIYSSEVAQLENGCTEPEGEAELAGEEDSWGCTPDGELQQYLLMNVFLDQGSIPGFQNVYWDETEQDYIFDPSRDPEEGNNLLDQGTYDVDLGSPGTLDLAGEAYDFWPILAEAYDQLCTGELPEGVEVDPTGHNDYGYCHGLAADGRMVGSTTYYFAIEWNLPAEVGNEVQTDSMTFDMNFEVVQHRHNELPAEGWPSEEE